MKNGIKKGLVKTTKAYAMAALMPAMLAMPVGNVSYSRQIEQLTPDEKKLPNIDDTYYDYEEDKE